MYDAFADVWDCEELWVTLDRLNLNPPNVRDRDRAHIEPTDAGFDIELHWDVDTTLGVLPQRVQGIIALNDTRTTTADSSARPSCSAGSRSGRPPSPPTATRSGRTSTAPSSPSSAPSSRPATC